MFAVRTLRHHGLPTGAIYATFQAHVIAELAYRMHLQPGEGSPQQMTVVDKRFCVVAHGSVTVQTVRRSLTSASRQTIDCLSELSATAGTVQPPTPTPTTLRNAIANFLTAPRLSEITRVLYSYN